MYNAPRYNSAPAAGADDFDCFLEETAYTLNDAIMTPERSPSLYGDPALLPRVRPLDHVTAPVAGQSTVSYTPYSYNVNHTPNYSLQPQQPNIFRRSLSPQYQAHLVSPISTQSNCSPVGSIYRRQLSVLNDTPSRPPMHQRSSSSSSFRTHSRNTSSSSASSTSLYQHSYPTYQSVPGSNYGISTPRLVTARDHLAPISSAQNIMRTPASTSRSRQPSPSTRFSNLSAEVTCDNYITQGSSSLLEYLTAPNPTPTHLSYEDTPAPGTGTHFWYDVRNIRPWTDFTISTIASFPGVLRLLQIELGSISLPSPCKDCTAPTSMQHLHNIYRLFHSVKVNAALKVAQGDRHMAMQSLVSGQSFGKQPEFVSNYTTRDGTTVLGDGRGRVVGIIRCCEQWNSGMRAGGTSQVKYLQGLSDLHTFMREHSCRYGFIMTEVELVCIRYGGAPDENNTPYFGFLELSAPIRMSTHGPIDPARGYLDPSNIQMTATLALFYLHMLAKDSPLQERYGWKLHIGTPSELTRQKCFERDSWMPRVHDTEKRMAKRVRGWVFPAEPHSRREDVKMRTRKAAARH